MAQYAYIGMGSNLGDRAATIGAAIDALDIVDGIAVLRTSSLHETPPVGGPAGQGAFLNAALKLETILTPWELLSVLQRIERDLGRVRHERWGQRTIDLDLLLYGYKTIDEPGLVVPHPRMTVRRFVLAPLVEIDRRIFVPGPDTRSVGDLLSDLDRRPGGVVLCGPDPDGAIAWPVIAGLGGRDLTRNAQTVFDLGVEVSDQERWLVLSRSSFRAARDPLRGARLIWPNFAVAWGPEAKRRRAADLLGHLGRPGHPPSEVVPHVFRVPTAEGGESSDDWVVAEILAACAASRVPTRVVGSP